MSPQAKPQNETALPNGKGSGGVIAARLLRYLIEHPGLPLFRAEIAEATGLSEDQVRTNLSNIRATDRMGAAQALETVTAGQVWMWHPNKAKADIPEQRAPQPAAPQSKRVFGEVGTTREGDLILQADDGSLWRASEL